MFSLKQKILYRGDARRTDREFFDYIAKLKERVRERMEGDEAFLFLAQRALVGETSAIITVNKELERQMREHPYSGHLPAAFRGMDVATAIYHEWIGYSVVAPWLLDKQYQYSQKMQIIGERISLAVKGEYHPYPNSFVSTERVEQLQRSLIRHDPKVRLDQSDPSAEFKIDDPLWPGRFIRVAIWIPPRVWPGHTTITFRRQIVENMTLEEQAGTGIISHEAVDLFRDLMQTYPNLIISGPVESGKTTFANTLVMEQLEGADRALGVVLIEGHPESTLPLTPIAKRHRIIPIQADADELMSVGIQSLRHDPDIIYQSEMRWGEWLFYNFAGEKGYRALIGTYHTKDAEDIPYQGAFAVYSESGGNLKGHIMGTLKSVELVAVLEPQRYGKKKLMRLSEIRYDPNSEHLVYANDLIRYDDQSQTWFYNADLSPGLWERMIRANSSKAEAFRNGLHRLAKQYPIQNPIVPSQKSRVVLEGAD
jgi:pilus assembly protein CpaF